MKETNTHKHSYVNMSTNKNQKTQKTKKNTNMYSQKNT